MSTIIRVKGADFSGFGNPPLEARIFGFPAGAINSLFRFADVDPKTAALDDVSGSTFAASSTTGGDNAAANGTGGGLRLQGLATLTMGAALDLTGPWTEFVAGYVSPHVGSGVPQTILSFQGYPVYGVHMAAQSATDTAGSPLTIGFRKSVNGVNTGAGSQVIAGQPRYGDGAMFSMSHDGAGNITWRVLKNNAMAMTATYAVNVTQMVAGTGTPSAMRSGTFGLNSGGFPGTNVFAEVCGTYARNLSDADQISVYKAASKLAASRGRLL